MNEKTHNCGKNLEYNGTSDMGLVFDVEHRKRSLMIAIIICDYLHTVHTYPLLFLSTFGQS